MVYLKQSNIAITCAQDVVRVFQDLLATEDTIDREKEHFYVLHLNIKSRIKLVELVSLGTLNHSLVHPRETLRADRAALRAEVQALVRQHTPP